MNKKVKAKWVKALRSGKYRKGTGCLRQSGNKCTQHCCLGVLTDLYAKEMGKDWDDLHFHSSDVYLSDEVQDWAGLTEEDPTVEAYGYDSLATLNDDGILNKDEDRRTRCGFGKIADIISKEL